MEPGTTCAKPKKSLIPSIKVVLNSVCGLKNHLLISLVFLYLSSPESLCKNYYFSSSIGNDSYTSTQAQNPSTPWKTIEKLNNSMSLLYAGDSVFFKRGEIFVGQILLSRSGTKSAKIGFSAYGAGKLPVIKGTLPVSGWTRISGNLWKANCPQLGSEITNFFINGKSQQIGRFPNADASNKGYLNIDSHTGKTVIVCSGIQSSTDWTGGEAVIRTARWMIDRAIINSHVGSTLNLGESTSYEMINNSGFFIQNHIKTLDQNGEWYYDSSKKIMYIYYSSDPNSVSTEASYYSYGLKFSEDNISVKNLEFKGALYYNLYIANSSNIEIKNCVISEAGNNAVVLIECSNVTFSGNSINRVNNNALGFVECRNISVNNNLIHKVGLRPGMSLKSDPRFMGIYFTGNNVRCESNIIDSLGYAGLYFADDTILIKNNYIAHFCMTVDDGGAIYTGGDGTIRKNRIIESNIIINGIGAGLGTKDPTFSSAHGIYLDDRANNIIITGNTIANCPGYGLYVHNSNNISLTNNTIYNTRKQLALVHDNYATDFPIRNCTIKNNIFFSKPGDQLVASFTSYKEDLTLMGSFSQNYYCRPVEDNRTLYTYTPSKGLIYRTLSEWQTYSGLDANSLISPIALSSETGIRFEYNATNSNKAVALDAGYLDVKGKSYSGSVTLLPFTSVILLNKLYAVTCGTGGKCNNETFTTASGNLTDNSCSSNYLNNMSCSKLIQPTGAESITLNFTAFNTESGYDFVRVYDGPTSSSPLLGTFSGTSLPPTIKSTGGTMLVTFTTDGGVVASGWSASYTSDVKNVCNNEIFNAVTGNITDNSGSLDYGNNMLCSKLIQPAGVGNITLTFTAFSTESGYDLVRVYDGPTTSSLLLGTFSGTTLPPVLKSSGGSMLITFTTDARVVASGWSATYISSTEASCTNETLTNMSGSVSDNSGSANYTNNMTCSKLIQPSGAKSITLNFISFNTESGYDFVRIYDGTTTNSPLLGEFSGSSLPPEINSSGGNMLITFITDARIVAPGWSATYSSNTTSGCTDEIFNSTSGDISDNSGSSNYGNNMLCSKLIQPSGVGSITLTFDSFNTESGYDFVRIYDGSTTSSPLLGTYSGTSLPPVLKSNGGSMLITFTTDARIVGSGWSATYTTSTEGGCINEVLTNSSGTITDNSGSSNYRNNILCSKLIQPSGAKSITLTFTSFNTEFGYDFVNVYNGPTTSSPLLGKFSGNSLPPIIKSSEGSMLVTFTTDSRVVASGWNATYSTNTESDECLSEIFTGDAGSITDNSGSSDYQNNMLCSKLIQPVSTEPIILTFTSFETEKGYDFVKVYDGPTTSSRLLGSFSGTSIPPVLKSSGGNMLITFTTDARITGSGWSAMYVSDIQKNAKETDLIADETNPSSLIIVYPNPTSGIFTIESLSKSDDVTCTINLINTSGQIIHNQKISSSVGKFNIDISGARPGSYFLQIITGKTVEFIKIIKY